MAAVQLSAAGEVIEAAELDNCGWFAKLFFVIVPMIRSTLVALLVLLGFIGKMKVFDLVWITTKGGPMWSTETVSTYVYKRAFEWSTFDLGYPSAIATVWFAAIALACVLIAITTAATAARQARVQPMTIARLAASGGAPSWSSRCGLYTLFDALGPLLWLAAMSLRGRTGPDGILHRDHIDLPWPAIFHWSKSMRRLGLNSSYETYFWNSVHFVVGVSRSWS